MGKAIHLKSHKIEDNIVFDALDSINVLKKTEELKGRIAGGMAVQMYIPKELHRLSIDLDFSLLWTGGCEEFRKISKSIPESLENKGYNVEFKKNGRTYEFLFERGEDSFMIQHPRISKNHFEKVKRKTLEREISNQRIIPKKDTSHGILSPEDIVVSKLYRALVFSENHDLWTPKIISIKHLKESLSKQREELSSRFPEISPREVASLRLYSDCYDVRCIATHVGLNKNYFDEVANEWDGFNVKTKDFYGLLDKLKVPLE